MRTDRQTADMTKLIVAFCNFANPPKNNIALINKIFLTLPHILDTSCI
jgi:hypothetical protein